MKKILIAGFVLALLIVLAAAAWIMLALKDLPDVTALRHYRPAAATEVLDRSGHPLTQYYDRTFRIWVPITSLPDVVIHAVVTAEDDTFFEHHGVNYQATWDAFKHDWQKRRFARGGSTITQQMIKNVLLTKEKTLIRKVREYVLARKAEEVLTKRQILQIYLNEVEWGDRINGIEAASRYYFGKHASALSAGEAALLAGMLPNPRYYNPFKRQDKARGRQEQVLFNMHQAKLITDEEYQKALEAPLDLNRSSGEAVPAVPGTGSRPCYQTALEKALLRFYGEKDLYRSGMTITTTLDRSVQDAVMAEERSTPGTEPMDDVLIVKQGGEVRAILCSASSEQAVQERATSSGFPMTEYQVLSVPLRKIAREELVAAGEGQNSMLGRKRN